MTQILQNKFHLPLRMRRNRKSEAIRNLVRETKLSVHDLVAPIFMIDGIQKKELIPSMPTIERLSIDLAIQEAKEYQNLGVQSIALFPVIAPHLKSDAAEEAWNEDGLLFRAISEIKLAVPDLCLISDVALDPFTSHGHDGLVDKTGEILNDETMDCLIKMALMQARAGVDIVAPSDMMDGRIGAIRKALDEEGFIQVSILAYSAKYASSLYRPFREDAYFALYAKTSRLQFGNKKTYQMDP